ncbi:transcriptional regulator [uncultured Halomonas sp.]|uniref:transcriptional regulator n=1 Tax=uncultured Halomonas sp. TaxID=173971 RepID=UPI00260F771E|nr:transcriptional regulator [uncultured Halomonas sp.]
MSVEHPNIRLECLKPAECWTQPTGEEVREALRLAGLTGGAAAKRLGLGAKGDRTVRRWIGEDSHIPYAAWALLCDFAGLGEIWKD